MNRDELIRHLTEDWHGVMQVHGPDLHQSDHTLEYLREIHRLMHKEFAVPGHKDNVIHIHREDVPE